jgi:hypothetical protein
MNPSGRLKDEYGSAQLEGAPVRPAGRPRGENTGVRSMKVLQ